MKQDITALQQEFLLAAGCPRCSANSVMHAMCIPNSVPWVHTEKHEKAPRLDSGEPCLGTGREWTRKVGHLLDIRHHFRW
jgi:hypothetical protein